MYVLTNSDEGKRLQAGIPMNLQLFAENNVNPQQNTPDTDPKAQLLAMINGADDNGNLPQQQPQIQDASGNLNPVQGTEGNQPAAGQQPQGTEGQPNNNPAPNNPLASVTDPQNGMILGKFKTIDDLVNAYQNLEGFNTQTRQDLSKANQTLEQLQGAIENLKQQNANSQVATNPNANTQQNAGNQNPQIDPQAFLDKFYENPIEALKSIMQPTLQSAIDPLNQQIMSVINAESGRQKQEQWQNDVRDFGAAHPDMVQFKDAMAEILKDPNIADNPKALDIAYGMAKGQNYTDPTTLLQDENYVKQNILNNPDLQKKFIEQYLQGVKNGTQGPVTIGNTNNGQTVLTPEAKPKNLQEAGEMARRFFESNQ